MCKRKSTYIIAILIPLAAGGLSALLSRNGMMKYQMLNKPPLSPPGVVFPVVWSILYLLMGISSAMILCSDSQDKIQALKLYAAQLTVNFFWSIIFFAFGWRLFAFFWLVLLLILTAEMIRSFYQVDKKAAYLQIPYLLWLVFAAYLNFGVWMLNR
ncbi:TspO/MBR family protein [Eisenbergiella porci]|uniref:TspO/MBR family protein n=1 Tax=Eisenbergiella porci TaxID=2652274 RepID=UPI002A833D0D|nr:TspO/MBR family protein [Eisenbergiella porci]